MLDRERYAEQSRPERPAKRDDLDRIVAPHVLRAKWPLIPRLFEEQGLGSSVSPRPRSNRPSALHRSA
jgi:hypothetical protein